MKRFEVNISITCLGSHTHMGLRSMKKVIKSFWVTAGENNMDLVLKTMTK